MTDDLVSTCRADRRAEHVTEPGLDRDVDPAPDDHSDDRVLYLEDDETGRPLEIMTVPLEDGELVIHAMDRPSLSDAGDSPQVRFRLPAAIGQKRWCSPPVRARPSRSSRVTPSRLRPVVATGPEQPSRLGQGTVGMFTTATSIPEFRRATAACRSETCANVNRFLTVSGLPLFREMP